MAATSNHENTTLKASLDASEQKRTQISAVNTNLSTERNNLSGKPAYADICQLIPFLLSFCKLFGSVSNA